MAPKAKEAAAPKADAKADAKPKGKAKAKEEEDPKMQAPDREEFDAEMEKISQVIEGFQTQQAALAVKINDRSGGKEEYFQKRDELKGKLNELSAKIDVLMEKKNDINKAMGEKRQEGMDMRNQLNKMKKSIGYTSETQIDDRIQYIEFKLNTETMTLKQEKDFLKEISDLKKNRPKVGQVNKMEDSFSNRDTGTHLRENIGTVNEELSQYRDGKRTVAAELTKLNEARKDQLGDLPKYIEERDNIGKKIKEQIEIRNQKRDEFRQKEREFNQWRNEQRQARQAKINEERSAQKAQWEMTQRLKKAEAMDNQPYVTEMTLLEQTIAFCKSLVADKGPAQKEEKAEIVHNNPDDTEVLIKKEDRDEFYYAPTANKKKGKSKKGPKEGGSSKPIKHNAETFRLFDQLKINAPITTEDIPGTLEKLDEQLTAYKQKVKDWEKNRDELKQKILAGEEVAAEVENKEEAAEEKADE